jgi:hypothetical protein
MMIMSQKTSAPPREHGFIDVAAAASVGSERSRHNDTARLFGQKIKSDSVGTAPHAIVAVKIK